MYEMNCVENAAVSRAKSSGGDGIMAKQRESRAGFSARRKGVSPPPPCVTRHAEWEMIKKHHRGREGKMDRGWCEGLNYKDESRCQ